MGGMSIQCLSGRVMQDVWEYLGVKAVNDFKSLRA